MSLELSDKIEWVDLKKIKLNPKNTNKHPEDQIDRLVKLINYQGFRWPLLVWKEQNILAAGEGRYLAAKKMGLDKVPVSYQSFKDEDQFKAFVTSDNAIASWAELDLSLVNSELESFDPGFDLDLLGIKDFELEPMDKYADKDADAVPEKVETRCKPGDLWILGEHRLLCGDSTNIQHVEKLMGGEKADITFTSPPYNAGDNIRGNFYENDSDDKPESEYVDFLLSTSELALQNSQFVFWNIQLLESNKYAITDFQSKRRNQIKDILIWNKTQYPPHINKGTFGCKWEYVFVLSNESKSRSFPCKWQGKFPNVIETENASKNEYAKTHKATFPVSFPTWVIEKMDFAKSVYDCFGGSGSTLIASEKTNRKCFMMELDPHYCDVIITRWEEFTGKKAELNA